MWVGLSPRSPMCAAGAKDVIGALASLKVPLVRWPGGCFADEYHWREGIGPRNKRPVKVNTSWGGVPENNAVARTSSSTSPSSSAPRPVNGNIGTGTPKRWPSGWST